MNLDITKLFKFIKKEFTTSLGRFNIYSCLLLCFIFVGIHFINFIKKLVIILFHEDIAVGNGNKFFYSILIYFIISLTLLAFKRKN
ncbi:hypothetical protein ES702_00847 [subsurface metagenome]